MANSKLKSLIRVDIFCFDDQILYSSMIHFCVLRYVFTKKQKILSVKSEICHHYIYKYKNTINILVNTPRLVKNRKIW